VGKITVGNGNSEKPEMDMELLLKTENKVMCIGFLFQCGKAKFLKESLFYINATILRVLIRDICFLAHKPKISKMLYQKEDLGRDIYMAAIIRIVNYPPKMLREFFFLSAQFLQSQGKIMSLGGLLTA